METPRDQNCRSHHLPAAREGSLPRCLLLPAPGDETLPRLLKGVLFQLSSATNPDRKAASVLITDFQGQTRTEECSACLLLIGKDKMQGGKEKHHSIFSDAPAQKRGREREKPRP